MQRRRVWRVRRGDSEHGARSRHVWRESRPRPGFTPLVVVLGCACDGHARVVRRAPADNACSERALVLAADAPVVRERQSPRIEKIRRPAPGAEWAVVRPGLDQADRSRGILGQTRGDHAACRATPDDHDVVSHPLSVQPRPRPDGRSHPAALHSLVERIPVMPRKPPSSRHVRTQQTRISRPTRRQEQPENNPAPRSARQVDEFCSSATSPRPRGHTTAVPSGGSSWAGLPGCHSKAVKPAEWTPSATSELAMTTAPAIQSRCQNPATSPRKAAP